MPPSHVRQEEAELRKIAKQARATRKEQQQKERRRVQRERRAAQKGEDPAASSSGLSSTQRQRRKSILVLPEEVEELKQRLHLADSGAETSPSKQPQAGKNKKNTNKKNKKGEEAAPVSAAPAVATTSAYPEPNYRIELHFKNKQILVDVDLHRVPPTKINVTGTTAYSLHVDTLQHTKKYQLDLPLPEQLVIDPKTATYEYREQTGVLHCALPIVNEELPAGLQAQWDGMVDSIRKQKALRFTVSKEGDLAVRTRQALLPQRTAAPTAAAGAAAAEGGAKKRGREAEAKEEEEVEEEEVKAPAKGKAAAAAAADAKAPKAKKSKKEQQEEKKEAKSATKKEKEHLLDERARAQAAAEAAGAKAQLSLKERVQQAKQVQQQRQTQLSQQQGRRQEKLKRQQQSFERVLAEQKAQLLAHAELQVATEVEEKRREAAKLQKQQEAGGKGAKTKKVSFA